MHNIAYFYSLTSSESLFIHIETSTLSFTDTFMFLTVYKWHILPYIFQTVLCRILPETALHHETNRFNTTIHPFFCFRATSVHSAFLILQAPLTCQSSPGYSTIIRFIVIVHQLCLMVLGPKHKEHSKFSYLRRKQ